MVQVYVSCPQGKLPKEFRRLAAFGKTKLLAPGETQSLTLSMDLYQLASYSEEQAAWLLETGTYGIWVGNALSTAALCGTFVLDETKVLVQCEHICPLKESLEELQADKAKLEEKQTAWLWKAEERKLPKVQISAKELPTETVVYEKLQDQYPGRAGEIVDQLSTEELIALATGDPAKDQGASALGSAGQTVPGAAAETVTVAEKGSVLCGEHRVGRRPGGICVCVVSIRLEKTAVSMAEIFWMDLKTDILRSRRNRRESYIISIALQFRWEPCWRRAGIWN